jgi:hypothetical protein
MKDFLKDESGHGPDGFGVLLILPILWALDSFLGTCILWLLVFWVPISLFLIFRKKKV